MFKDARTFSSFSVDDIASATRFYADTLGLTTSAEMGQLQLELAGGHRVFIYGKPDHAPATFTVLNFVVPDIDKAVSWLGERGIRLERYSQPELQTDGRGIHRGRDPDEPKGIAWFKDPAGNILSVLQE
jgi:catechol 2,3-dioxygenase-like lactoylglutathione lyase family enzyme